MYISRTASSSVLAGTVLAAVILTGAPLAAGAAAPALSVSPTANPAVTNQSPDRAVAAVFPADETQTANMVNAVGRLLATKPGTPVSVIRAPARTVWDAVSPDVTTLDTTPEVQGHTNSISPSGAVERLGAPTTVVLSADSFG